MDFLRLDGSARQTLAIAQSLAVRRGHSRVGPEHLLLGLLRATEDAAASLLIGSSARPEELSSRLESVLERVAPSYGRGTELAPELEAVLAAAERVADAKGSGAIECRHILAGLLDVEGAASNLLRERGVTTDAVLVAPTSTSESASTSASKRAATGAIRPEPESGPFRELSAEAAAPVVGRDDVLARIMEVLVGRARHPILLGEEGVGKSAVVEALARALRSSEAPRALIGARVLAVRPSFFDEDPERLSAEWQGAGSRTLLYMEDPRLLAQALRISRGSRAFEKVTFIGAATPEEYYDSLSRQTYLERRLATVLVEPLTAATTILVLRSLRPKLELERDVRIHDEALEAAPDLAGRYLPGRKLPGAASELLKQTVEARCERMKRPPDELERAEAKVLALQSQRGRSAQTEGALAELRTAAGWLRARWEQEREARERLHLIRRQLGDRDDAVLSRRLVEAERALPDETSRLVRDEVGSDEVARVVEKRSGVHLGVELLNARHELVPLEANLGRDVLGQREAVRVVASALMRGAVKLGRTRSSGPAASFWFTGPPGVGKAETARSLARHLLHDEEAVVTVRSDEASKLLEAVAARPRSVVLVRDADRISSGMARLLRIILEDGVVGESRGRGAGAGTDFRRALLVLSSRGAGASFIAPRVDAVVKFRPLGLEIARLVVDRRCRELADRLAAQGVDVEWTVPAMEWLAERGFSREEGLHRLDRAVADEVGAPLGRMLVLGELARGARARISVRVADGRLECSNVSAPACAPPPPQGVTARDWASAHIASG